ncbi:YqjF family protein [Oceanobacillus halophilus]|uniref:DUF2071 domain-containing protein n=1 Tax=Oceanobacillus halophilus TaxID=930130 RepID=A0A495A554_9BACI|nr:DUF2071 domain-containing protein [Oceanobacillus halophilus]RKQ34758.1 DUF2071 domain-containing protein [Oceanobacillus halophilus]
MDILNVTDHRPFPFPSKHWMMKQKWKNISFLHWPLSESQLRPFIPKQLTIDTYHGQAWVGMVIFEMESIHLRGIPKYSITPNFSEVNVRTYVTYNGVPGIYFLSIDVDNWASVTLAKRWYHLPYHSANISIEKSHESYHYESIRHGQSQIKGEGMIHPLPESYIADKDSLDYWLMERYRLYSINKKQSLYKADIHHKPWSLQKAETTIHRNTILSELTIGLDAFFPAVSHFSSGLDTLFWNIKRL